jgi:hypothetical protein
MSLTESADTNGEDLVRFLGKSLLVGITRCDMSGNPVSQEQFHGTIKRISRQEGLVLLLAGTDTERSLPPEVSLLETANPGEYRLRTTGEVVMNPDFTATWSVYPEGYRGPETD